MKHLRKNGAIIICNISGIYKVLNIQLEDSKFLLKWTVSCIQWILQSCHPWPIVNYNYITLFTKTNYHVFAVKCILVFIDDWSHTYFMFSTLASPLYSKIQKHSIQFHFHEVRKNYGIYWKNGSEFIGISSDLRLY